MGIEQVQRLHLIMGVHCNVRCIMCYQTSFSRDLAMPAVIYQEHLRPLYPVIKSVKLQGGEPTIMRNCKEFCIMARQHPHIKIAITTNGININDFWLATLVEQGQYVNVSLNAARAESYDKIVKHGNFAKAVGNISRLVAAKQDGGLKVAMSMIVLPVNALEIADFLQLGLDLGVKEINFGYDPVLTFHDLPPAKELHPVLERAFEIMAREDLCSDGLAAFARRVGYPVAGEDQGRPKPRCPLPFNNLVVDEKGDVRVCCNTWVKVGNTYEQGIERIMEGEPIRRFQALIKQDNYRCCDPGCTDNAHPHRLATLYKYAYTAREDPREFATKVKAKLKKMGKV